MRQQLGMQPGIRLDGWTQLQCPFPTTRRVLGLTLIAPGPNRLNSAVLCSLGLLLLEHPLFLVYCFLRSYSSS